MEPEVRENYRVVLTAWAIVLLGIGETFCVLYIYNIMMVLCAGCLIVGIILEIINHHVEAIRGLIFFIVAIILLVPGSMSVCSN